MSSPFSPQDFQTVNDVYLEIGKRYVSEMQFQETLKTALDGSYNFAAKKTGTKKNCNPAKSHFCQTPNGSGSCVSLSRKCKFQPAGSAKQAANYVGQQVQKGKKKAAPASPQSSSDSPIKVNQPELDSKRADLEKRFGQKLVEDAENNVKRILDDADVFVRVRSSATLERILGDRFRTSAELNITDHEIPNLKDKNYQDARNRVEAKTLGYDKNTDPADRPIYGYLGSKDLNGQSHADVSSAYGSIAVKLKREVKDRTTFTGADSFKSGIASQVKNDGPPPPPNAASLVASTRHGYDKDNLPNHYPSYFSDKSADGGQLRAAAQAKSIDDLTPALSPTGNAYMEAQIHGKVTPKDIAEIHFSPRGAGDRPNAAIAQFAKDNGVDLYVNGKKLSSKELDDIVTPPKRTRVNDLNDALEQGDFEQISKLTNELRDTFDKAESNLAPGEEDAKLKALYELSGYDSLPTVGTAADVTQAWKDGGTLMVRGVATDGRDRTKYLKQYQTGDYFTGNGVYGNGTYVGHAGKIVNGKFVGYDPATEQKDAKRAFDDVARHGYISPRNVTMRMAIASDARIGIQSDVLTEQKAFIKRLDSWQQAEEKKIQATFKPSASDTRRYNKALTKAKADNAGLNTATAQETGSRKINGGYTTKLTYTVNDPNTGATANFDISAWKDPITGRTNYSYVTETGRSLAARSKKDAISSAQAIAVQRKIDADALAASGLKVSPAQMKIAAQKQLNELKDKADEIRGVLGLDPRDDGALGRFGVIRGYDAIALDRSYEPKTFMILLNRGKTIIQQDELTYAQGKKTGAL